eukprot:2779194-Prymnesium_polylepis.1
MRHPAAPLHRPLEGRRAAPPARRGAAGRGSGTDAGEAQRAALRAALHEVYAQPLVVGDPGADTPAAADEPGASGRAWQDSG